MIRVKANGIARATDDLRKMEQMIDREANKLIKREANVIRGEIVRGIRDQAPGGVAFEPLAKSTEKAKGSSLALIDRGDLIGSVAVTEFEGGKIVFVGVNRTAQDSEGNMLEDIAAVHEFGTGPSAWPQIPARPFIQPVIERWEATGPKRISDDLDRAIRGS